MRAFGIGLPLAAELRRGHWNVLLWARLGDACLQYVRISEAHTHTPSLGQTEKDTLDSACYH